MCPCVETSTYYTHAEIQSEIVQKSSSSTEVAKFLVCVDLIPSGGPIVDFFPNCCRLEFRHG